MSGKASGTAVATQSAATGTGLTVIDPESFMALQADNEALEAMQANMLPGEGFDEQDLIHVPTPSGGGTTWIYDALGNEVTTKVLRGVLVAFCQRGTLWPSEEPSESMPYLVTDDLRLARKVGDNIGTLDPKIIDAMLIKDGPNKGLYDWRGTEEGGPNKYNDFGSSAKGAGKRCKESRVLFLLPENSVFPMVIRAQPGSLKSIKPFIKTLPVPHWRAVVELSLEKMKNSGGQDYARIVPKFAGDIGKEAGKQVRETYTVQLQAMASKMKDGDDSGLGD